MVQATFRNTEGDPDLVIGRNLTEVARLIKRELRWKRISTRRWLDQDRNEVVYVSQADYLDRYPDRSIVYLTPGASERDDWYEFEAALYTHRAKIVEL